MFLARDPEIKAKLLFHWWTLLINIQTRLLLTLQICSPSNTYVLNKFVIKTNINQNQINSGLPPPLRSLIAVCLACEQALCLGFAFQQTHLL